MWFCLHWEAPAVANPDRLPDGSARPYDDGPRLKCAAYCWARVSGTATEARTSTRPYDHSLDPFRYFVTETL